MEENETPGTLPNNPETPAQEPDENENLPQTEEPENESGEETEESEEEPEAPEEEAEESEENSFCSCGKRDYAALARRDLLLLQAEFPELLALRDLTDLPDPARYGELRDLGCSPVEAYLATRREPPLPKNNRAHLLSSVPLSLNGGEDDVVSAGEIARVRALFSDLSDAQIRSLYKRVSHS